MIQEDESFERELFAMRALPSVHLDVSDVLARAERLERATRSAASLSPRWATRTRLFAHVTAWAVAAMCFLGVTRAHHVDVDADSWSASNIELRGEISDGLSCRADVNETIPSSSNDRDDCGAMCVAAPSSLVCGRDVTFSIGTP